MAGSDFNVVPDRTGPGFFPKFPGEEEVKEGGKVETPPGAKVFDDTLETDTPPTEFQGFNGAFVEIPAPDENGILPKFFLQNGDFAAAEQRALDNQEMSALMFAPEETPPRELSIQEKEALAELEVLYGEPLDAMFEGIGFNKKNYLGQVAEDYAKATSKWEASADQMAADLQNAIQSGRYAEAVNNGEFDALLKALNMNPKAFLDAFPEENALGQLGNLKPKWIENQKGEFLDTQKFYLDLAQGLNNSKALGGSLETIFADLGENPYPYLKTMTSGLMMRAYLEGADPKDPAFITKQADELAENLNLAAQETKIYNTYNSELQTLLDNDPALADLFESVYNRSEDPNVKMSFYSLAAMAQADPSLVLSELLATPPEERAEAIIASLTELVDLAEANIRSGNLPLAQMAGIEEGLNKAMKGTLDETLEVLGLDKTAALIGLNQLAPLAETFGISHKEFLAAVAMVAALMAKLKLMSLEAEANLSEKLAAVSEDIMAMVETIQRESEVQKEKVEKVKAEAEDARKSAAWITLGVAIATLAISVGCVAAALFSGGSSLVVGISITSALIGAAISAWQVADAALKVQDKSDLTTRFFRMFNPEMSEDDIAEAALALEIALTAVTIIMSFGATAGAAAARVAAQKSAQTAAKAVGIAAVSGGDDVAKAAARRCCQEAIKEAQTAVAKGVADDALKEIAASSVDDLMEAGTSAHTALMKAATIGAAREAAKLGKNAKAAAKAAAKNSGDEALEEAAEQAARRAESAIGSLRMAASNFLKATEKQIAAEVAREAAMTGLKGAFKTLKRDAAKRMGILLKTNRFVRNAKELAKSSNAGVTSSMIRKAAPFVGENLILNIFKPLVRAFGRGSLIATPAITGGGGHYAKLALKRWFKNSGTEEAEEKAAVTYQVLSVILIMLSFSSLSGHSSSNVGSRVGQGTVQARISLAGLAEGISSIQMGNLDKVIAKEEDTLNKINAKIEYFKELQSLVTKWMDLANDERVKMLESISEGGRWFMTFISNLSQTVGDITKI